MAAVASWWPFWASKADIGTVNLLVARNIPVTFAQPASAVISELEPAEEMIPPKPPQESKPAPKETKAAAKEPEIRKAKAVRPTTVKKALPYSPGVKQFHSNPAPLPTRRAVPLQRFNQEGNGNG